MLRYTSVATTDRRVLDSSQTEQSGHLHRSEFIIQILFIYFENYNVTIYFCILLVISIDEYGYHITTSTSSREK